MKRDWCIDSVDAGWSPEDTLRYWRYGESSEAFVEWYSGKYGLIGFYCHPGHRKALIRDNKTSSSRLSPATSPLQE